MSIEISKFAEISSFRPLSWGLSFNILQGQERKQSQGVFVPFLGDFLSMTAHSACISWLPMWSFRPLSWGLSFNYYHDCTITKCIDVFVPFLGDFLSITIGFYKSKRENSRFRPLSWGLSFNFIVGHWCEFASLEVFVPFLGDFLSIMGNIERTIKVTKLFSSPFLGTFFQ